VFDSDSVGLAISATATTDVFAQLFGK
jgi:hypothetical protein